MSSYWERNSPIYSTLRSDIDRLQEAARSLLSDTRNTTSVRRFPRSDPGAPPPCPRPITDGMDTPTIARQPEEHPLDIMHPGPAHLSKRDQGSVLPI
jgi:hypothetical protein